jgi:predicted nucleic-acid-binding protein
MRAIDTNVLVRLITRDDLRQAASGDVFIEDGAWVSLLALAESISVLDSVYRRNPSQLATAIEMLLDHKSLTIRTPTSPRPPSPSSARNQPSDFRLPAA